MNATIMTYRLNVNAVNMSLQELEQDPFDADDFVERLAWRTMGGHARNTSIDKFDPLVLHSAFEKTIKEMKELNTKIQKSVEQAETTCHEEERQHWQRIGELQKHNQTAFQHFQALDERINFVATKVVHLGDQLEGVNTPRTRASEAQILMKYFNEFVESPSPKSHIFNDPFQVKDAASVIQKLYLIAQELPSGDKFDQARERINKKYAEIERMLTSDFKQAHFDGDKRRMKELATTLSQFKDYNTCIDIFINEVQKGAYTRADVYADIPPLCARTHALIVEVFINPEVVMSKFLMNIYHTRLQRYLESRLASKNDIEKHLAELDSLYSKTKHLSGQLSCYKVGNDAAFLTKVTKNIFSKWLQSYISEETRFLREKCASILNRFYENKKHQKKSVSSGGIHEFRRDLQAAIGAKANLNLGPTIENYGGETFLSQEIAISVLQESKLAFKRCQNLSAKGDAANNAAQIFDILVHYLCIEHIEYALELGLLAIPLSDPKSKPAIYFFDVVEQANSIFHLFEKQFSDSLVPLMNGSTKYSECLQKKRDIMEHMENKLDHGLDRTVAAMVGWVKHIVTAEQKKTDFKPENDEGPMQMYSSACGKVCAYVTKQIESINNLLDGKNVDSVLMEFGVRFHRIIYDHLLQFQYNSMGAMLVICDVNEYRKCMKDLHIPLINQLFDTLHSLCNLLMVIPENIKEVCSGEQLATLDKSVLLSFVALRSDYKTARLASFLK